MPARLVKESGTSAVTHPGGKNGPGVYQRIINHMPPHRTYIEAFLGSGAVLRAKRPAALNIGLERSSSALDLCLELSGKAASEFRLLEANALADLPSLKRTLSESVLIDEPDTLVYADPPYLQETRKGGDLYDFELSDEEHTRLLEIATNAKCMVMISGYRSDLYDEALWNFTRIDYQTQTRRGMVPESLWMNFKPPSQLHDYRYLGENYRERAHQTEERTLAQSAL